MTTIIPRRLQRDCIASIIVPVCYAFSFTAWPQSLPHEVTYCKAEYEYSEVMSSDMVSAGNHPYSKLEKKGVAEFFRSAGRERFDTTNLETKAWDPDGSPIANTDSLFARYSRGVQTAEHVLLRSFTGAPVNRIYSPDTHSLNTIHLYKIITRPFKTLPRDPQAQAEAEAAWAEQNAEVTNNADGTVTHTVRKKEGDGPALSWVYTMDPARQLIPGFQVNRTNASGDEIPLTKSFTTFQDLNGTPFVSEIREETWNYDNSDKLMHSVVTTVKYDLSTLEFAEQEATLFTAEGLGADYEKEGFTDYRFATPESFFVDPEDRQILAEVVGDLSDITLADNAVEERPRAESKPAEPIQEAPGAESAGSSGEVQPPSENGQGAGGPWLTIALFTAAISVLALGLFIYFKRRNTL